MYIKFFKCKSNNFFRDNKIFYVKVCLKKEFNISFSINNLEFYSSIINRVNQKKIFFHQFIIIYFPYVFRGIDRWYNFLFLPKTIQ